MTQVTTKELTRNVYNKRETAALSHLYTKVKIFIFTVNERFFSIFLPGRSKDYGKSEQNQSSFLLFAVALNVKLELTIVGNSHITKRPHPVRGHIGFSGGLTVLIFRIC